PEGAWALLNLLTTILTLLFGVLLVIGAFRRNKKAEEQSEEAQAAEETERNPKSGLVWRILSILFGPVSLIVFLLTENMRLPMVFTDNWSLLMVILLVAQVVGMLLLKRARDQEEDKEDEAPAQI
ncbi:hypothetical protein LJC04_02470, partial [Ruminococcaceae bacterium OttesenSCG-928-O06]|nr:hypothetical protein [Ruminococcaceae bacterium OttesenSCG-928-O06]